MLEKRIPAAAGLAGGSADAAAVIILIDRLFGLGLPLSRLCEIGFKIGADVPYCIRGGTALSEGIGEKLTALHCCPDCFIVLAKIPEGASTGAVYTAFDALEKPLHPDVEEGIKALEAGDLKKLCKAAGNSLEAVTKEMLPQIAEVEKYMLDAGALSACMSGSGPTVFGIFDDEKKAADAEVRLLRELSDCFAALVRPVG